MSLIYTYIANKIKKSRCNRTRSIVNFFYKITLPLNKVFILRLLRL